MRIRITEVECKTALSESRLPGYDYALNPYKGCTHGCRYCYVPNLLDIPRREWGSFIEVKRNMPKVLASELRKKKRGTVGISTTTDPYQSPEKEHRLTRYCLEQLMRFDFPVSILTKSDLVVRDLDLLSRFSEKEVGITITTANDSERSMLEPHASSIESRIKALEACNKKGIATYAYLGPLYPTMRKEELETLVERIKEAGTVKIMADRLNQRPGVWSAIYNALNKERAVIWKDRLFGKHRLYDDLFDHLKKTCQEKGMVFELQAY
jgi:DNA repair photolyase